MPPRREERKRGTTRTRQGTEPKERAERTASRRREEPEGTASEFLTHLIGKHGSVEAAARQLSEEQIKLRRRAQDAEDRADELEELLPEDGFVSVSADDGKLLEALKAGNKDIKPDGVTLLFTELATLRSDKVTAERDKNLQATVGKKYNLDTLSKLLGNTPIEFQKVNVMKEDKTGVEEVLAPFVVTVNADNTKTKEALDTYVERTFKNFLPVLLLEDGEEGEDGDTETTERSAGPRMPRQTTSSASRTGKAADIDKVLSGVTGGFMTPSQRRKAAAGA